MLKRLFYKFFCMFILLTAGGFCLIGNACAEDITSAAPVPAELKFVSLPVAAELPKALYPDEDYRNTCLSILRSLKYKHYKDQPFDDSLSNTIFDRYFLELDTRKIFFLSSDIQEFEYLRYSFDDRLKKGDITPAYSIFNRYRKREAERLYYLIKKVKSGFKDMDFNIEETLEKDREKASWPGSAEEQVNLWRKHLKYDVLNLKLAKKAMDEIQLILEKRYSYQLKRLNQQAGEDAFNVFMNVVSHAFDPHSAYLPPSVTETFNIMMRLSLEGVGAVLQRDEEYTKILSLIPAGPADKSGELNPGDRIIGIGQDEDGEIVDVIGWRLDDVVKLIRGPKDTVVRLEVIPADSLEGYHTKVVKIIRKTVNLEDQAAKASVLELEKEGSHAKIGVIEIPSFYIDFDGYESGKENYKSTTRDVRRILNGLKEQGTDGILIDLRDNGGGALQEATALTGLFIDEGPVVQIQNERGQIREYYDPDPDIAYKGPLVVLVNRLSASASEIFAGAMQDYKRGIVIGSQTYGKGSVQAIVPLLKGQLKITQAIFFRVSGESTQHRGIVPDIIFPSTYDMEEIGESSKSNALLWSRVDAVDFSPWGDFSDALQTLKHQHQKRIKDDIGIAYLKEMIQHLQDFRRKENISLKESDRIKEWEKFEKINDRLEEKRKAASETKGFIKNELKGIDNDNNLKEGSLSKNVDETYDPLLYEGYHVLFDLIKIKVQPEAM